MANSVWSEIPCVASGVSDLLVFFSDFRDCVKNRRRTEVTGE